MELYDKNDTMILLGQQQYAKIISETAAKKIRDICMAREGEITENAAVDVYILGFLDGSSHN